MDVPQRPGFCGDAPSLQYRSDFWATEFFPHVHKVDLRSSFSDLSNAVNLSTSDSTVDMASGGSEG
eukprot:2243906-Pleurochrysis_carterae.AAC.2